MADAADPAARELRRAVANAIADPGATEGYKGDRTLTEWQLDAVMRVLVAHPPAPEGVSVKALSEADIYDAAATLAVPWYDSDGKAVLEGIERYRMQLVLKAALIRSAAPAVSPDGAQDRLPTMRCDQCDNGIETNWPFCAWCGCALSAAPAAQEGVSE